MFWIADLKNVRFHLEGLKRHYFILSHSFLILGRSFSGVISEVAYSQKIYKRLVCNSMKRYANNAHGKNGGVWK